MLIYCYANERGGFLCRRGVSARRNVPISTHSFHFERRLGNETKTTIMTNTYLWSGNAAPRRAAPRRCSLSPSLFNMICINCVYTNQYLNLILLFLSGNIINKQMEASAHSARSGPWWRRWRLIEHVVDAGNLTKITIRYLLLYVPRCIIIHAPSRARCNVTSAHTIYPFAFILSYW